MWISLQGLHNKITQRLNNIVAWAEQSDITRPRRSRGPASLSSIYMTIIAALCAWQTMQMRLAENEFVLSICTDISRSATDWWCKPSPYSLVCDLWLLAPRGVKLITLWLVWPLLWKGLDWGMTTALAPLAALWPNCGQGADHPNPRGMWPWPCHTLCG